MRLTLLLLRRNYLPNGNIRHGKRRMVNPVLPFHLKKMTYKFEIEENNMLLLRHPYLTEAESHGHAIALNKKEDRIDRFRQQKVMKKKTVLMEDILNHLNVTKRWD